MTLALLTVACCGIAGGLSAMAIWTKRSACAFVTSLLDGMGLDGDV